MPPRRSERPTSFSTTDRSPPFGAAPSATTMIAKSRPALCRCRIFSATGSRSYGISGMRIASAVPATPAPTAIQPA